MDDILLGASSLPLLIKRVHYVLGVCRKVNSKLSPKKFKIGSEVTFGGFRISRDVANDVVLIQPSLEKIEAVKNLKTPQSKQEVQSLVGFLSQLSSFVPSVKTVIPNIRRLTSKFNPFQWTDLEEEEFKEVKKKLQTIIPVTPVDTSKPLVIHTDASNSGLGWILTQRKSKEIDLSENWRQNQVVIEMGSTSLTDCQSRY